MVVLPHLRALVPIALVFTCLAVSQSQATEVLPSWRDSASRDAIIGFVDRVTADGTETYVDPAERVATFDNDGTLWAEQPVYFQGLFALDRLRAKSAEHPEWKTTEPYKSAIAGDVEGLMATGMEGVMKVIAASHSGVSGDEFFQQVSDWLADGRHPDTGRRFTEMVYQPMLELIDYLHANDFKVFIVSGGGIDFIRVFSEQVYDIPPERVVGTTLEAHYELRDGVPVIVKDATVSLIDDKAGKPIGIYRHIGRRPIMAVGNSDGDMQMLEYTTIARDASDNTRRMGVIVRHTDAEREYAYDRDSHIGKLDQALDDAPERGWLIVDMQKDWSQVYPTPGE